MVYMFMYIYGGQCRKSKDFYGYFVGGKCFGNKILFGCKQVLEEDIGFTGTRFTLYIL